MQLIIWVALHDLFLDGYIIIVLFLFPLISLAFALYKCSCRMCSVISFVFLVVGWFYIVCCFAVVYVL